MNKLKTIIGALTLIAASSVSAQCVVTSDQIKAMAKLEDTSKFKCQLIHDQEKDIYANAKDYSIGFRKPNKFSVMITNQDNVESIDLSGLDTKNDNTVVLEDNPNLKEIKVGKLTKFSMFNIRDTKISDLTFLENITSAQIYIDHKVTKFPNKNTPFCEGVRNRGKITIFGDVRNNFNKPAMIENCKLEE